MEEIKIDIYVSHTCGACRAMKMEIEKSDLKNLIQYKYIDDEKSGDRNINFIKNKGFKGIPVTHMFNGDKEVFEVGYIPIKKLCDMVNHFAEEKKL